MAPIARQPERRLRKRFISFGVPKLERADYRRLRHIGMGMPAPAVYPILRLGPF